MITTRLSLSASATSSSALLGTKSGTGFAWVGSGFWTCRSREVHMAIRISDVEMVRTVDEKVAATAAHWS
jgi:hypothetical protein